MKTPRGATIAAAAALCIACAGPRPHDGPPTPAGTGPTVRWDLRHKPLPEIPLPNDTATILDPTSPTGRRLNVSLLATTALERDAREKFDRLDGFGVSMPVSVAFDAPLDLDALSERHDDDDMRDDAVFLVNVDPDCETFGEEVVLDLGRGRFPLVTDRFELLFQNDPHAYANNLLFEEHDEDTNGNGALDPGEDIDFDGHLDRPNLHPDGACDAEREPLAEAGCDPARGAFDPERCDLESRAAYDRCVADHLLTFYEKETDTLLLQPIWPLEQMCTYAAVLTRRLVGVDGEPVRSPLDYDHPAAQRKALEPLWPLLERYDLEREDVAFAWTFTTGSVTRDLETLRAGLYGHGPMAALAARFPVDRITLFEQSREDTGNVYTADANCATAALKMALGFFEGLGPEYVCPMASDLGFISHVVQGSYTSPYLLGDSDGAATERHPHDDDEVMDLDWTTGRIDHLTEQEVTFWCAVPKPRADCPRGEPEAGPGCPPFPVVIFAHGYTLSREEARMFMGRHAAFGLATCAIDSVGHGDELAGDNFELGAFGTMNIVEAFAKLAEPLGVPGLMAALGEGRMRDLDMDGLRDSGGDFWTADLFHTRDVVRQSVLDLMQLIRILRSFDGNRTWDMGAGPGELAGDLDGDGVVDLGGELDGTGRYSIWGISLGGILAAVLPGIEPAIEAAAPLAGGAGLARIGVRSVQGGVPEAVFLPLIGPFILGRPLEDDPTRTELAFLVNDVNSQGIIPFATSELIEPGDRVVVQNLRNGDSAWAVVDPRGRFRVGIAADALTATERRVVLGMAEDQTDPQPAPDTTLVGDPLEVVVYAGSSEKRRLSLDAFAHDVDFQGTRYPEGQPVVALGKGFGYHRNSPELRRFLGIAQIPLDAADPVAYAPHYFARPLSYDYDPKASPGSAVLVVPTVGDQNVPIDTGLAIARAAGTLGSTRRDPSLPAEHGWRALFAPDASYATADRPGGRSKDQVLVDTFVYEGIERLRRFEPETGWPRSFGPVLFDPDNLSKGDDGFDVPRLDPPLRATLTLEGGRTQAMRLPYFIPEGQHGFYNVEPWKPFDVPGFMLNQISAYFAARGEVLPDDRCMECTAPSLLPEDLHPGCTDHLKLCDLEAECAAALDHMLPLPADLTCPHKK